MTKLYVIEPKFVEFIPEQLEPGLLYASMQYATVAHLCCCGCGNQVVTPLAPHRWKLLYDGRSISLSPSIGNWSFTCQSHYWIRNNHIEWAHQFTVEQIKRVRDNDRRLIEGDLARTGIDEEPEPSVRPPWYRRLRIWRHR